MIDFKYKTCQHREYENHLISRCLTVLFIKKQIPGIPSKKKERKKIFFH